jgi:hypothetical protein
MSLLTSAKHELKEIGLVTLYFMLCFAVILTLKKLFLAEYAIEFYALSAVVIGALVAGKVVVVLDHTPLGTLFDSDQRLGLAALYRALIYSVVAFLVLAAEKVFHAYRESGALGSAITEAWEARDRSLVLAKVLCVGFTFLGYHLFIAADRRLGNGTLWRALWARK